MSNTQRLRNYLSILSLLLLTSILMVCDKAPDSETPDGEKVVRLRYSYWGTIPIKNMTERVIAMFEERHPNIKVQTERINRGYVEKILTELAADTAPDVMIVGCFFYRQFVRRKVLLNLTPFIQNDPDFSTDDFHPHVWDFYNWRGNAYGIPGDVGAIVLYYNEELFDEAGLRLPPDSWDNDWWDWDTFVEYCKKLTKDTDGDGQPDQYGIALDRNLWDIEPWVYQNDGKLMTEDGSGFLLDMPETVEAMEFLVGLSEEHHVAPTPMRTLDMGSDNVQLFKMGRIAMYPSGFWRVREFGEVDGLKWNVTPFPYKKKKATTWHGASNAIWAKTKHPRESWEFLKFIVSPEIQSMWAKEGLLIPSLISLAKADEFLEGRYMPKNAAVFVDALDYAERVPDMYDDPEVESIINEQLDLAWNGIEPVADVCKRITEIIKERQAK